MSIPVSGEDLPERESIDRSFNQNMRETFAMLARLRAEDDLCKVCGAGPSGFCSPPDEYVGDCPHGCSPER